MIGNQSMLCLGVLPVQALYKINKVAIEGATRLLQIKA